MYCVSKTTHTQSHITCHVKSVAVVIFPRDIFFSSHPPQFTKKNACSLKTHPLLAVIRINYFLFGGIHLRLHITIFSLFLFSCYFGINTERKPWALILVMVFLYEDVDALVYIISIRQHVFHQSCKKTCRKIV